MPRPADRVRDDTGMSSVVLIWGAVALLLATFLVCLHGGAFTYGWVRADAALDAYARARSDGLPPARAEQAALASLSPALRATAEFRARENRLELSVQPRAIAGLPMPRVTATLGPRDPDAGTPSDDPTPTDDQTPTDDATPTDGATP